MGQFSVIGLIEPSHSGHSFKVYILDDNGKRLFFGLIQRSELQELLRQQILKCDICKYDQSQTTAQEPLF
jgi:hypothetical protein